MQLFGWQIVESDNLEVLGHYAIGALVLQVTQHLRHGCVVHKATIGKSNNPLLRQRLSHLTGFHTIQTERVPDITEVIHCCALFGLRLIRRCETIERDGSVLERTCNGNTQELLAGEHGYINKTAARSR